MNIAHLKYAVEIANTKSISKAAENLYMGQPNLSRAIKSLEDTIGINVKNTTSISDNAKSFEDILKNCKDGNTVTFWMKKE